MAALSSEREKSNEEASGLRKRGEKEVWRTRNISLCHYARLMTSESTPHANAKRESAVHNGDDSIKCNYYLSIVCIQSGRAA